MPYVAFFIAFLLLYSMCYKTVVYSLCQLQVVFLSHVMYYFYCVYVINSDMICLDYELMIGLYLSLCNYLVSFKKKKICVMKSGCHTIHLET
jgi:hypothetical protein